MLISYEGKNKATVLLLCPPAPHSVPPSKVAIAATHGQFTKAAAKLDFIFKQRKVKSAVML